MVKTHFCCQNWFFNVQTYKFYCQITKYLGRKISWSISTPFQCQNFMLNPIPFQFCAQLRSIPTVFYGQSRFHGQWQSRSTCTRSQPRLPAYLRYLGVYWEQLQYFTDDVGSRVIRQVIWVLKPVERITCNVSCLHDCRKSGRLWQENSAASFLSLLYRCLVIDYYV